MVFVSGMPVCCRHTGIQSTGRLIRKRKYWLRLDFLFEKGVFHTNFSITAPDFFISPEILG